MSLKDYDEKENGFVYLRLSKKGYADYQIVVPSNWKVGEAKFRMKEIANASGGKNIDIVGLREDLKRGILRKMRSLTTKQILAVLKYAKISFARQFLCSSIRASDLKIFGFSSGCYFYARGELKLYAWPKTGSIIFLQTVTKFVSR